MISSAFREKIIQVITRTISVEDLEEWMVPRLRTLIRQPDSADSDAVSAIELGLAEMRSNIRTEQEFMTYLQQVLQENMVIAPMISNQSNIAVNSTTSVNTTETRVLTEISQDSPFTIHWGAAD